MDRTTQFYSGPSYQFGSGFPVYGGSRRQRGGSILGAIQRFAMPIFNTIKNKALRESMNFAKGVMSDTVRGKSIKQSLMNRGMRSVRNVGASVATDALRSLHNRVQTPAPRKRPAPPPKRLLRGRKRKRAGPKQSAAKKRRVTQNF